MTRKAKLRLAAYILFFLCLTAAFSVFQFPRENLTTAVNGWLSEFSDRTLSAGEVSLRPPFSLRLNRLTLDTGKNRQVLGDAAVSPALLSLITGKRAVRVSIDGPWADSKFRIGTRGEGWTLDLTSLVVDLGALPIPETVPISLKGEARGTLKAAVADPANVRVNGQGSVHGSDIEILGGLLEALNLPPLKVSSLDVFFTVEDNVLTLKENRLDGDVSATARGSVRLTPSNPANSRLDLTVDIQPGPDARESLGPLLALLGVRQRSGGKIVLRIQGSVGHPMVTS